MRRWTIQGVDGVARRVSDSRTGTVGLRVGDGHGQRSGRILKARGVLGEERRRRTHERRERKASRRAAVIASSSTVDEAEPAPAAATTAGGDVSIDGDDVLGEKAETSRPCLTK